MINKETIEEVKNRLVKTYNPIAIYLFGSYAWGKPTEDSDLDLLIVVEKINGKGDIDAIRLGHRVLFGMGLSKDIIVQSRDVFERRSAEGTTLEYKIKNEGVALYARA